MIYNGRPFLCKLKRSGPRTEPCRTPAKDMADDKLTLVEIEYGYEGIINQGQ